MARRFRQTFHFQRAAPMLQGFDGPLAFAVFLLACAGLLTMYSSGFDHGTRFADHGRNMLIAGHADVRGGAGAAAAAHELRGAAVRRGRRRC